MTSGTSHPHPLVVALPLFLLAGLCLTTLDTTGKFLVRDHALALVVWARYVGQMLVVTPFARHRAGPTFWRTRNLKIQLVRSAFLMLATVSFFGGLRYLPLAEASAMFHLAPVFIVVLSQPLLGERPTRARWMAVILGFTGVLVLLRPGGDLLQPAALLLLAAAFFNGMYQLLTRLLPGDSAYTTLFYSALVGAIVFSVALPWIDMGDSIGWRDGAMLLAMGLLAGTAHWLLIRAFLLAPAAMLSPFAYAQMIWAVLFGWLVFGHLPDGWSALGMTIIVGSGVMLALLERRRARLARAFP